MHMCVRTKEEKETEISERNTEGRYVRYVERMCPARMRYIIAYTYIHIQFYVLSNPRGSEKTS